MVAVVIAPGDVPAAIARAGEQAAWLFTGFFSANIRNRTPARPMPRRRRSILFL